MVERCFLASSLWRRSAFGTFVGRRGVGLTAACRIISNNRLRASSRLRSWVRCCCATITMTPSFVRRLPARRISRTATSLGNEGEWRASKRSWTADDTLLTFWPPGPDARTKDSASSDSSMEIESVMRIMTPGHDKRVLRTYQILLRKHFALFHRRLTKWVHAEQMSGNDRLTHEMHHQFAERFLIESVEVKRAYRTAIPGQRFGCGPPFRSDQVADGLAAKARFACKLREFAVNPRSLLRALDSDDGELLVARPADEQLQLAVLIDRPQRRNRRGPLAIFAKAFGPELHVPVR